MRCKTPKGEAVRWALHGCAIRWPHFKQIGDPEAYVCSKEAASSQWWESDRVQILQCSPDHMLWAQWAAETAELACRL